MNKNERTMLKLAGVVVFMGAAAWAAVPFYDWFCRTTGFGGTTNVAEASTGEVLDRTVRVRFDANSDTRLGWTFRPMQRELVLPIGQEAVIFYEAINHSDHAVTGMASYNVVPEVAGYFFNKMACFCFTEQTLQPGERVAMPVSFFVDPEMVRDRDAGRVRMITLSYTFHPGPDAQPQVQARLDAGTDTPVN